LTEGNALLCQRNRRRSVCLAARAAKDGSVSQRERERVRENREEKLG